MPHPLVLQLRFTRNEFQQALAGLTDGDARQRLRPMNCISWNIGHLAWQEQRYWLQRLQGQTLLPELDQQFCYGCPAITPPLDEMWSAWSAIVSAADPYLDTLTTADFLQSRTFAVGDDSFTTSAGNLMQRVIYHYWYHTGESLAVRQMLGHAELPDFVGNIDDEAPYQTA
ncbi:MAG: DinB family protein [Anaerolineales bacterium]